MVGYDLLLFIFLSTCSVKRSYSVLSPTTALRRSSALHGSRVLQLRGGGGLTAPVTPSTDESAPPALQLSVVEGQRWEGSGATAMVGLGSIELTALNLTSGARVRITKAMRRPGTPIELVAEVVEDPAALEGSIRIPRGVMQGVQLRAGDAVFVAASTEATTEHSRQLGKVTGDGRRNNPWMRALKVYAWVFMGIGTLAAALWKHIE